MKQSKAIVKQRQQRIFHMFEQEPTLYVTEVAKQLELSELTIRRDFELMASKGLVTRFHGGARLNATVEQTPEFSSKDSLNHQQKQMIAKVAATHIEDNDTVFINAGTTTLEVIKVIKDKPITIVTNSAPASEILVNTPAKLICTGGEFNSKNRAFAGPLATNLINKIFSNITILGVNGLSAEEGVTTAYYPETMINEEFLKQSKGLKIVVADGSKLGKTYSFNSTAMKNIDIVITDSSANEEEVGKLKALVITVILADKTTEGKSKS
ncbi:MAG: DeoR/GlpR family DNA-binding transcription regulator [Sphaerochaetaceae bacterium]|jgi:DeoR/GlpR family transcriptional regulator of sugar metabolism|nr:DeoR/GlpR family DNA-binding transcription regulator [Sphaerochaetaceae bacterium]